MVEENDDDDDDPISAAKEREFVRKGWFARGKNGLLVIESVTRKRICEDQTQYLVRYNGSAKGK